MTAPRRSARLGSHGLYTFRRARARRTGSGDRGIRANSDACRCSDRGRRAAVVERVLRRPTTTTGRRPAGPHRRLAGGSPAPAGRRPGDGALGRARRARPDDVVLALHALRHERDLREALRHRREGHRSCRSSRPRCPTLADGGRTVSIPLRDGIRVRRRHAVRRRPPCAPRCSATSPRTTRPAPRRWARSRSIDTPDDRTVVLHYKTPFAPITASLADRAGMIMSPDGAASELGDDFGNRPGLRRARSSSSSGCRRPRSRSSRTRTTTTPKDVTSTRSPTGS